MRAQPHGRPRSRQRVVRALLRNWPRIAHAPTYNRPHVACAPLRNQPRAACTPLHSQPRAAHPSHLAQGNAKRANARRAFFSTCARQHMPFDQAWRTSLALCKVAHGDGMTATRSSRLACTPRARSRGTSVPNACKTSNMSTPLNRHQAFRCSDLTQGEKDVQTAPSLRVLLALRKATTTKPQVTGWRLPMFLALHKAPQASRTASAQVTHPAHCAEGPKPLP